MITVHLWARAFAITAVVESAVAVPMLTERDGEPVAPLWRRLGIVLFAQVMSHPAVWFIFPALGATYTTSLFVSEAWAVGSELLFYRLVFPQLRWSRAVAVACLANAASFGVGLLVRRLLM